MESPDSHRDKSLKAQCGEIVVRRCEGECGGAEPAPVRQPRFVRRWSDQDEPCIASRRGCAGSPLLKSFTLDISEVIELAPSNWFRLNS